MKQYTVKEIADLVGKSKTTIQKAINAANIEYDEFTRNKQYYSTEKTRQIIEIVQPDFDFSIFENQSANSPTETANSQEKTENSQTKIENSPTETANSQSNIDFNLIIDELHRSITIFENELKEKNEQIKEKDKEIQQLNEIINKHLYITAREKKLIEAEAESETESESESRQAPTEQPKEPKKKGFFKRLFNR